MFSYYTQSADYFIVQRRQLLQDIIAQILKLLTATYTDSSSCTVATKPMSFTNIFTTQV